MRKKKAVGSGEDEAERGKKFRSASREIAYIALTVALITVCAWISLPVGEVPFTLQTFAIALAGGLLGWKRGTLSVAVYVLMGLIGIPVFAGFKAGVAALFGATGGYIFGFFFAVLITGLFKLIPIKAGGARALMLFGANLLGMAVCYLFGTLWFMQLTHSGFAAALMLCVVPYLLPDAIKLALAAILSVRLEKFIK